MTIAQILRDQRQELDRGLQGLTLVSREAEKYLHQDSRLIQVVSGVRRCGKSVLIYKMLQGRSYAYVNFDDDRILDIEPNDILAGIYQVYGKEANILFLDEIQNLDHWELFVNRLHRAGFKVFLTGSNAKLLAKEMATHLTGRHHTIELFPFSFKEYLQAHKFNEDIQTTLGKSQILRHLQEYLQRGGFPEVILGKEDSLSYLRELYQKIIERDIVSRYNVAYKKTLKEIARSIVSNPGRQLSYGKLRRQFGLGSDHTVKNYLSYLAESYLLLFISKFSFKPVEIEKSEKKAYCIDVGMAAAVGFQTNNDFGHLYENMVALELLRQQSMYPDVEVYYWRDQEEVDFVLKRGSQVTQIIQVCLSLKLEETKKREFRALLKCSHALHCKNLLVLTLDEEGEETATWFGTERTIRIIPLWKWILQPLKSDGKI